MPRGTLIALFVLISSVGSVFAEADPPPIRFGFFPKHGEDVVYRIELTQESTFRTQTLRHRWTHELVINISGTKPPADCSGNVAGTSGTSFKPNQTNPPSTNIANNLNKDSKATAITSPRLCSAALARRVPNRIANTAIANATYKPLSRQTEGTPALAA